MKNLTLTAAAALLLFASVDAQQLRTPAPSSTQTVKQDFGLSNIELSYSRPGMKNRKIYGDLVPFGKVWRTGANNATTVTFGEEVSIGGKKVPAGKYGLVTIPDKNSWTIIITKQTDITSPANYKMDQDVVRVEAKPVKINDNVETFTMQFANVKPTSLDLQMLWENTMVSLPITTDVETRVMAQIDNLMNKDNRPYFAAAMYYMDNGKDMNQALTWLDKAIEQNPKAFWIHHQRANALAKLGKKDEAKTAANKSMELAKEAKNDDYVRLNEKLLAEIKVSVFLEIFFHAKPAKKQSAQRGGNLHLCALCFFASLREIKSISTGLSNLESAMMKNSSSLRALAMRETQLQTFCFPEGISLLSSSANMITLIAPIGFNHRNPILKSGGFI